MTSAQTAGDVLDRHYLELRCEILNLAAALDRIERADGYAAVADDARLTKLAKGLEILGTSGTDRAERVQLLFSDEYQSGWNK